MKQQGIGMSFQGAGVRLPVWSIIISPIWSYKKLNVTKKMIFNMFKGEEIWQNLSGSNFPPISIQRLELP